MNWRNGPTREFDYVMALATVGLVVFGLLLIYSGTLNTWGSPWGSLSHPASRQAAFAFLGVVAMIAAWRFEYRLLGPLSLALYVLSIAGLLFVLAAGESEYGSRRWIDLGVTEVQPSEVAKVATIVLLAKFFSDNEQRMGSPRVFALSLGIAGLPAGLVLLQPDLGSALVFGVIWLATALMAGVRLYHLAALGAAAAAAAPVVFTAVLQDYQIDRFRIWRDAESDPLGRGYQVLQAEISAGSGGFWGKGLTHGTQTQLDFLRTQTTDYIFSVGAEELGFAGMMVLFSLFVLLLFRCVRAASVADDSFGRLLPVGVASFILFQAFVNVAVNIRLLPVTGVTLPLVSQGGSSLVTVMLALGLVQSVLGHRRRRGRSSSLA
ncbi:MAG TPA: rod shape-determining protein RodA [Dehalococcoidia bacterium]|nr:rod shape-determining protein RodA [Dehalococcoidia bacterium]